MPRALICAQAFPPLLKQAGGVAKDYLALCRALIDGLGWEVTLLSPVDIAESHEQDVERWLKTGQLLHAPAWSLEAASNLGVVVFLDFFSIHNTLRLIKELSQGDHSLCFIDDSCLRIAPMMLMRGFGLPSVATTHSDVPSHPAYSSSVMPRIIWWLHLASSYFATVHAACAKVYADLLWEKYSVPVHSVWPPVLWSNEFRRPLEDFRERASKERARWNQMLGYCPRAIFLFAGRWSAEKRIHLLAGAVPDGCALVIVGDSDSSYADEIEASRCHFVLPLRGMLGAEDLRVAYAACDLFVSASTCETLGNTVVEAWSSGVPVAIQPVGGHLEFVKDKENSYLIDFDDTIAAQQRLNEIVSRGASQQVEPALSKMGEHFRSLDFAAEVQRTLLDPALLAAEKWQHHSSWRWLWEMLLRTFLLLVCCLIWPATIIWSRAYFALSCDPTFRYLKPGTAVEPEPSPRSNANAAGTRTSLAEQEALLALA
eukprot:TRINITY_DN28317_c0_g1_i1.p1 TRINITY_DN28317_c0_g1~~TRINITY_DN28317_c0_g1_i1.p1  ORF type:complete len:494 (-),score=70.35 TRINITY_DN28317_c0_g1_i1:210-1664(-)